MDRCAVEIALVEDKNDFEGLPPEWRVRELSNNTQDPPPQMRGGSERGDPEFC